MKKQTVSLLCCIAVACVLSFAIRAWELAVIVGSHLPDELPFFSFPSDDAGTDGAGNGTVQTNKDYQYVVANGKAVIINYWGAETAPTVPDTLDGYTVVGIGAKAFYKRAHIVSVTLPETVIHIDEEAFSGCTALESIPLPNGLVAVGRSAFDDCPSLRYTEKGNCRYLGSEKNPYLLLLKGMDDHAPQITIDAATRIIGPSAFREFQKIESVSFPSDVIFIGASAFSECKALKSVTLPQGVTSLESAVFYNCTALKTVALPAALSTIGQNAFYGCAALTEISLPATLTSIGVSAFSHTALVSVAIPDSVTSIGSNAFLQCSYLKNVELGENSRLTRIASGTFARCATLERFYVPKEVSEIGGAAFQDTSIKLLVFDPQTKLTLIRENAFEDFLYSSKIYKLYFGTVSRWASVTIESDNDPFKNAERYYYSEEKPTEGGAYWHYDSRGNIVVWQ